MTNKPAFSEKDNLDEKMVKFVSEQDCFDSSAGKEAGTLKTIQAQLARGYARWEEHLTGMEGAEALVASSGISFRLWRLYQHFWLLVCLLFPVISLVREPRSPVRLLLALAALVFFAASYIWFMWPHPASSAARSRSQSRPSLMLFAMLVALVVVLSLIYGLAFLWLFIGVSGIAGVLLPVRRAFVAVTILIFLPLVISVGITGSVTSVDWLQLIPLMLLVRVFGLDMIGMARLSSALRNLHITQEELTRLKVEEERLRMARDLHDLLGHTLSLITLKSKLAGRLVEQEPARAAQEIREIERVARQALREVREAVAGYRQPRLANEVDSARQLLEAAGIECSLEYTELELPTVSDAVLAWTVREGVTNVIRHSYAHHCIIRLNSDYNTVCTEVINDGDQRERSLSAQVREGLGLAGLTERVTSLGGCIEAGPVRTSGKTGFRLWVELPIKATALTAQKE
jgi:two-component system, NarL family, sensor histidine kinase DesK